MKFSEIESSTWEELRPYLDTCLIPVTGLTGNEQPFEVTLKLEQLRDVMDWVEQPFKGRMVTYPSFQYGREEISQDVNEICHRVKQSSFSYAVVISAEVELTEEMLPHADLILTPGQIQTVNPEDPAAFARAQIQRMWEVGRK